MDKETLAKIADALANVGALIKEVSRQADQGGAMPADVFDTALERELYRLRTEGQAELAEVVSTIRNPIHRFLSVGW